jgi:serine/threonine protein kinase
VDGVPAIVHDERLDSGHIAAVRPVARSVTASERRLSPTWLDNVVVIQLGAAGDPTSVKVVDLGIARITSDAQGLTQMGTVVGTISYLAPELLDPASVEGEVPEAARDVFAFGVMGWLLVTGRHPSGLPANAKIADYVRAYRAARKTLRYPSQILRRSPSSSPTPSLWITKRIMGIINALAS